MQGPGDASSSGSDCSRALLAQRLPATADKKLDLAKTYISSAFPSEARNSIDGLPQFAPARFARSAIAGVHATCGVDARASTLDRAKMLVFLSRCSNPNAVFAIPAGTNDNRHSLTARRAAWRRSERRRRSQRQRRARARQSAGRKSKYSPLPVFDFERCR
jgi:hypothetical protein